MIKKIASLAVFAAGIHPKVINFCKIASAGGIPASNHTNIVDVPTGTRAL
jgi:hypothetical protein